MFIFPVPRPKCYALSGGMHNLSRLPNYTDRDTARVGSDTICNVPDPAHGLEPLCRGVDPTYIAICLRFRPRFAQIVNRRLLRVLGLATKLVWWTLNSRYGTKLQHYSNLAQPQFRPWGGSHTSHHVKPLRGTLRLTCALYNRGKKGTKM